MFVTYVKSNSPSKGSGLVLLKFDLVVGPDLERRAVGRIVFVGV